MKQINNYSGFCEHLKATKNEIPAGVCTCAYAHICSLTDFAIDRNGSGTKCTKWIILLKEFGKSRTKGEVIWHTA